MSDTMLHGILNMPPDLWSATPIDQAARHARYVEAPRQIIDLARQRDEARAQNTKLRAIAEAAVDWLYLGNPDDVRAGVHIRAKLDLLNEEAGE